MTSKHGQNKTVDYQYCEVISQGDALTGAEYRVYKRETYKNLSWSYCEGISTSTGSWN